MFFMMSGPVVLMIWEGKKIVSQAVAMVGATDPLQAASGTIRGDLCLDRGRNLVHASDSLESAAREIDLWFRPEEMINWGKHDYEWIYEI